jgi:DNA-binding XRE family transcriptional regulator
MNLQKQAAKLQAERKSLGYTQKSLAAFLGCSKSAVIAWENAQNPIPDWVWKMLRQQPSIMPMFSIDEFASMQKKAEAQGQTLQQWVESVIKSALIFFLAGLLLYCIA